MTLVESNAAFLQRCTEIDATGNFGTLLAAQNITNFSGMAFSMGTPQAPPTDAQFTNLAGVVFGAGATLFLIFSLVSKATPRSPEARKVLNLFPG